MRPATEFILSSEQMHQAEAHAFELGLPQAALMEKAALGVASAVKTLYPIHLFKQIGVIAGVGHNGADALVVARELLLEGREVSVHLSQLEALKPLTQSHLQFCKSLGAKITERASKLFSQCDILIDGLFGIGLSRELSQSDTELVKSINASGLPVVSLDVPSGLNADTGTPQPVAVRASHTFCLGAWKAGMFEDQAQEWLGKKTLMPLGLQNSILAVLGTRHASATQAITKFRALAALNPHRPLSAHKYSVGRLLLVAGSKEYPGAAALAALGAQAAGVGYMNVCCGEDVFEAVLQHVPDSVKVSLENLPEPSSIQAVVCGPGFTPDASLLEHILKSYDCPVVLDAGAFKTLKTHYKTLQPWLDERVTVTPHSGEFKQLIDGFENTHDCPNRIEAAQRAARTLGITVVLKGPHTVIATPGGRTAVNLQSTAALARAGTGDVLAGLMGGLLAQKVPHFEALLGAVWWHAQTALLLEARRGMFAVQPVSLAQYLNPALATFKLD